MSSSDVRFCWSDAWLFLAIGVKAQGKFASLLGVLNSADAIQHAIPTKDEVDGAIGRLQRAGYVQYTPDGLSLQPAGAELLRKARKAGSKVLEIQRALETELHAIPFTSDYRPTMARQGEPEIILMEEWENLMARYRTR